MSEQPSCCRWCAGFLFSLGLTSLFMWLSLRPSKPTYSIESFYIPVLNKTANDTRNTTISFDLRLKNENKDKGIYYDALDITLYYGHNLSSPIGNVSISGFYQGHKKKAHRVETVQTVGVPWETAKQEVSNGTTIFRVDLATAVRYKIMAWKTGRHKMKLGVNVTVNDQGLKTAKKGVELSCASVHVNDCTTRVSVALLVLILLFLI
ncbi:Late embryogenesis abundant protein [Macleaya cordata]|uniref:Late embryogenesis abundant protein n=1 Tax=Macleaya cordata TaxID=56857 RepID=A0A200QKV0_MACCD|nr:Late embryogenesis abundant protein [Macleaya cordata]